MYQGIIPIPPRTKKNSQEIRYKKIRNKRVPFIVPSKVFRQYQHDAGYFIRRPQKAIEKRINIKALYYMDTKRKVDITNLNGALHDILTHYGVIKDDDSKIVRSTDGSRVYYDKENPRTEFWITEVDY